jgi:homoserine O-acetyltransferase
MKLVRVPIWMLCTLALALMAGPGLAADYPAPTEGSWVARDFRFHTGETLPELRLHYTTVGVPTGEPVLVLHGTTGSGAGLLTPNSPASSSARGSPWTRAATSSSCPTPSAPAVLEALGRLAGELSPVQLRRHGSRPVSAGHRAPRPAPREAGHRQLDGRHARLDVGAEVSGLHGHRRAHGVATDRDVGPELADAPADHRLRPERPGVDERQLHEAAAGLQFASVYYGLATSGGNQRLQKDAPTREKADQLLNQRLSAPFRGDANDHLYQWDASRDYNASADLERIEATLLAINSADDERNPPELGLLDREIKRVKNGRVFLIPASDQTAGHGTTGQARFWKQQLAELLQSAPRKGK